jgi:hypothetical protein
MTTQVKSSNLANNISVNIGSTGALTTTHFNIQESGGKLVIKYGSNTIFSIDSSGIVTANTSFIAGGTP